MIKPPLWQLAKKSLSKQQNARQFSEFLKNNQMKPSQQKYINPQDFYTRLSVLLLIFQLENAEGSLALLFYLIIKIGLLFSFRTKKWGLIDLGILLIQYAIFPKVFSLLPLELLINWSTTVLYFFGGVSQRWLILQILTINSFRAVNFGLLIIFSLGKLKHKIKYSRVILIIDVIALIVFKRFKIALWILLILLITHIICHLDRQMIVQKRRYSHLFQIAQVQQFH